MYNEDYLHAIGEKLRPKPDNLKLLLVAGAAFLSAVIMGLLLAFFYWNGVWHLKTPAGEPVRSSETHDQPASHNPAESH